MNLSPKMNVGELVKLLEKLDPKLPIYIGKYYNRTPTDPSDTDLSGYEPQALMKENINIRSHTTGFSDKVNHPHLYISDDSYGN